MNSTFHIDPHHPGLSHLLVGAASLESVLVTSPVPGLQIIPAGDIPPNPSELLSSTRMSDLLSYLASDHVVIVDAPPVLPVTDAVALAEHTDGVLLVIRSGSTTEDQLRQAAAGIRQGGGTVLGIALNQVPSSAFDRLRYGETVYGYTATDRIPSSRPTAPSRTSPERRTMNQSAAPSQSPPDDRHTDAEHVGGTADTASMEEFVAMLKERRSTASRWTSTDARTWRARTDNRRTTSTTLKTRAR